MGSVTVTFTRDLRGRVVAMGTSDDPARFGSCRYRPDGLVASATQAGASMARLHAYDALARPLSIGVPLV